MTWGGWLTMTLSVGLVSTLFAWSVYRVLKKGNPIEKLHGIEDIDKGED